MTRQMLPPTDTTQVVSLTYIESSQHNEGSSSVEAHLSMGPSHF